MYLSLDALSQMVTSFANRTADNRPSKSFIIISVKCTMKTFVYLFLTSSLYSYNKNISFPFEYVILYYVKNILLLVLHPTNKDLNLRFFFIMNFELFYFYCQSFSGDPLERLVTKNK